MDVIKQNLLWLQNRCTHETISEYLEDRKSDTSRKNLFSRSYGTSPITDDGKSYAEKGMIGYSRFRRNCQSPLCCSGPNVQHELDLQTE